MLTLPSQLSSSGDGLAETEQQTTHSVSPLPLRGRKEFQNLVSRICPIGL